MTPLLRLVGSSLLWIGSHESPLGAQQPERLFVIRYRSHRRFRLMTLNPYYLLINGLRERGVRAFETSFTRPLVDGEPSLAHDRLLAARHDVAADVDGLAALRDAATPLGLDVVYAAREEAAIDVFRDERPTARWLVPGSATAETIEL